eukprot:3120901-Pleurochrysis_carterae.AAC.1
MKANAASKAVFQNTLKYWVKDRPTLAKWLRLIEHDYALQRPALQTREHDQGETGDRVLDAANTIRALQTPPAGACGRGFVHRSAPLCQTTAAPAGATDGLEACDARDASRGSIDADIGDRGSRRGTTDVRAPDKRLLHQGAEGAA